MATSLKEMSETVKRLLVCLWFFLCLFLCINTVCSCLDWISTHPRNNSSWKIRLDICEKYHLEKIKFVMPLLTQPNGNISQSSITSFTWNRNKKAEPHCVFKSIFKKSSSYCSIITYRSNEKLRKPLRWTYSLCNSTCERNSPACEMQSLFLNLATSPMNYAVPYGLEIDLITFLIFTKWGLFGKW